MGVGAVVGVKVGLGVSVGCSVAVAVGRRVAVGGKVGSGAGLDGTSPLQAAKIGKQIKTHNPRDSPCFFMMIQRLLRAGQRIALKVTVIRDIVKSVNHLAIFAIACDG